MYLRSPSQLFITRPLCLLASFTLYGGYEGYKLECKSTYKTMSTPLYLETNILDFILPLKCARF